MGKHVRTVGLLVVLLSFFLASPARAAEVADGTLQMRIEPGSTKLCVVVPDDQLDPSCDPMVAARIASMTEALAQQQHARLAFAGSLVGSDWVATVTVMRTSDHGEMSEAAVKALASQFGPEQAASATESRVNGLQVIRVENRLGGGDSGEAEGYVLTHVIAGKTNYILTLAGPSAHANELQAIAMGAVATVKLEAPEKVEVTTKETDGGWGLAAKIGLAAVVAILVVLVGRAVLSRDEDPPPPARTDEGSGKAKKKKKNRRGGR